MTDRDSLLSPITCDPATWDLGLVSDHHTATGDWKTSVPNPASLYAWFESQVEIVGPEIAILVIRAIDLNYPF